MKKQEYYIEDTTILKMTDVSLSFGEKLIFKDVNVDIKDIRRKDQTTGQIIGFLGPSGRGKTQLFKIISGLRKPTTGDVLVNGKPVHPGDVGVVAQNYPLMDHMKVKSNLMLALAKTKLSEKEKLDKIMYYLDRFKLADKIDYYPASLSGGQKQRVAIIQQVLCSEGFLLLDEPFSGLDIKMIDEVCRVILEVANLNELSTVIVISHDIESSIAISNFLWLMGNNLDAAGNPTGGAGIYPAENLMDHGIAWNYPEVFNMPVYNEYVKYIRGRFATL
jgi:ABC-type nitrate/sulfonate/bicarbonate transport system ATPase subunit